LAKILEFLKKFINNRVAPIISNNFLFIDFLMHSKDSKDYILLKDFH